jgi:hypothetical protein
MQVYNYKKVYSNFSILIFSFRWLRILTPHIIEEYNVIIDRYMKWISNVVERLTYTN